MQNEIDITILIIILLCNVSRLKTDVKINEFSTTETTMKDIADYESSLKHISKNITFSYYPTSSYSSYRYRALKQKAFDDQISEEDLLAAIKGTNYKPGENGKPVILQGDLKSNIAYKIKEGWKNHAFNEFVSSVIPIDRSLPDVRDEWCHKQVYSTQLPIASVVICFHNEARSTLMRTVYSVLNRTPAHLLKEIVLFDDFSRLKFVSTLEEDVQNFTKVKLVRASSRQGIIRARMKALDNVTAPIVVYLDSHCECTEGWLEPLLDRIADDKTRVVSPVVDGILADTFRYKSQSIDDIKVGAFSWDRYLKFTWKSKDERKDEKKNPAEPFHTPTISGGLFAIDVDYFKSLGMYDPEFEVWGGENLELSFKTWMCGGSAEIVPCSRVGHVFRSRFPYDGVAHAASRNIIRLAEVWMDDYKKYFYETIGNELGNFGNVSDRIRLRKGLKCKSFKWYLNKFSRYLQFPDQYAARGQIRNIHYDMCLEANVQLDQETPVDLQTCHHLGHEQYWVHTKNGELKRNQLCLDFVFNRVTLFYCRDVSSQVWVYNERKSRIRNAGTQDCLTIKELGNDEIDLDLEPCTESPAQTWEVDNYDFEKLSLNIKKLILQEIEAEDWK